MPGTWGTLKAFGMWGMEAANRPLKPMFTLSLKRTPRKRTGETGPVDILKRVSAVLSLRRHPGLKRKKCQAAPKWVRDRAKAILAVKYAPLYPAVPP